MMEPDLLCADQKDKIMSAQPSVVLDKHGLRPVLQCSSFFCFSAMSCCCPIKVNEDAVYLKRQGRCDRRSSKSLPLIPNYFFQSEITDISLE